MAKHSAASRLYPELKLSSHLSSPNAWKAAQCTCFLGESKIVMSVFLWVYGNHLEIRAMRQEADVFFNRATVSSEAAPGMKWLNLLAPASSGKLGSQMMNTELRFILSCLPAASRLSFGYLHDQSSYAFKNTHPLDNFSPLTCLGFHFYHLLTFVTAVCQPWRNSGLFFSLASVSKYFLIFWLKRNHNTDAVFHQLVKNGTCPQQIEAKEEAVAPPLGRVCIKEFRAGTWLQTFSTL